MEGTIAEIDVIEAKWLVDSGQAALLDVREPMEWEAGHAPEAIHMPLGSLDTSQFEGGLPLVVICRVGGRSAEATRRLAAAGVAATNISGGMMAWDVAGQPVVRDDGGDGLVI